MRPLKITPQQYIDLMLLGVPCYSGYGPPHSRGPAGAKLDLYFEPDEITIRQWAYDWPACWTFVE